MSFLCYPCVSDSRQGASAKAVEETGSENDIEAYGAVSEAIGGLAKWPGIPNVSRLRNHEYGYRLRVGRYRILFDVDQGDRQILVQKVTKRDDRTY